MTAAVVYVDVDDTLVRSIGTKRIPMPRVIQKVRKLHSADATHYLWSSGGADYAKASAEEIGIANCFTAFLPKPTLIIDDKAVSDWRYLQTRTADVQLTVMATFADMKTWTERLGHTSLRSFTDEHGSFWLEQTPAKNSQMGQTRAQGTIWLGSSISPAAHTPGDPSSTARSTRVPKQRRNSSRRRRNRKPVSRSGICGLRACV